MGSILSTGESEKICEQMKTEKVVVIDSNGGLIQEFLNIGQCIDLYKPKVIVKRALSAAGYTMMAGDDICYYKDSMIGYHTPHILNPVTGEIREDIREVRLAMQYINKYLDSWGTDLQIIININWLSMMTPANSMSFFYGDTIKDFINSYECKEQY